MNAKQTDYADIRSSAFLSASIRRKLTQYQQSTSSSSSSLYGNSVSRSTTSIPLVPPFHQLALSHLSSTEKHDLSQPRNEKITTEVEISFDKNHLQTHDILNPTQIWEDVDEDDITELHRFVLHVMPLRDFLSKEWKKIYKHYTSACKPFWKTQKDSFHVFLTYKLKPKVMSQKLDCSIPSFESPFLPDSHEKNFKSHMTGYSIPPVFFFLNTFFFQFFRLGIHVGFTKFFLVAQVIFDFFLFFSHTHFQKKSERHKKIRNLDRAKTLFGWDDKPYRHIIFRTNNLWRSC